MYVPTRIHKYASSAQRGQKRASDILTLEKQAVKPPDVGTVLRKELVLYKNNGCSSSLQSLKDLKSKGFVRESLSASSALRMPHLKSISRMGPEDVPF